MCKQVYYSLIFCVYYFIELNFVEEPKYRNITTDGYKTIDLRANKNLGVYKGALYENIVSESLTKQGCSLYYYQKNDSSLKQDFFVRTTDNLVPVEVKATNGKAKSLTTLINSKKYEDIQFGIKLINGNIGFKDNIYTFPYFCTFLLKNFLNEINH